MAVSGCVSQVCGTTLHSYRFHHGWRVQCKCSGPLLRPKMLEGPGFVARLYSGDLLERSLQISLCSCTGHNLQVMMHECINSNRDEMVQNARTWQGCLRTPSSHLLTTIAWTCEPIVSDYMILHVSCLRALISHLNWPNGRKHCLARRACIKGDAQQSRVCSTNDRPLRACTIPCPPDTFQQRHSIHFHDSISAWGCFGHVIPQTIIHFARRNVKSWTFRCQSVIFLETSEVGGDFYVAKVWVTIPWAPKCAKIYHIIVREI